MKKTDFFNRSPFSQLFRYRFGYPLQYVSVRLQHVFERQPSYLKPLRPSFRLLLLPLLLIFLLQAVGCGENNSPSAEATTEQTYTCPMHPQVVQHKPGTCPICGMDLVAFDKNNMEESLTLNPSQIALANITVIKFGKNEFSDFTRLNGRLTVNPENTSRVTSRVAGRIECLSVKESGIKVEKGQVLYRIYSEQLSALQQEYLMLHEQAGSFPENRHFQQLAEAARQKLMLYGQTEKQTKTLLSNRRTDPYIAYVAPASGIVAELTVMEGQYVEEGSLIMQLEAYNNLWVEADVYPSYLSRVAVGQQAKVIVAGYEDRPQTMTIRFISPALQPGSQLLQARGTIDNPDQQWQPGLRTTVLLPSQTKNIRQSLPVDAVIRDGSGAHVWVETEPHKYEPRKITTGAETSEQVEVTGGLEEGEQVVATGAYLLYSEFILKKGKDPLTEIHHH